MPDYKKLVEDWLLKKNDLWGKICALSIPLSVSTEIGDKLLLIGEILGNKIILRDFDDVCVNLSMDSVEGDNDQADPDYMPKDTIWIDWDMKIGEYKFIILHESVEHWLMKTYKLEYQNAHDIANYFEKIYRQKFPNK